MKRIFILFMVFLSTSLYAEDELKIDEDEYFSNPDSVVEKKSVADTEGETALEKKSVGVSGEILSVFPYMVTRDYVFENEPENNDFSPYVYGNLSLDARLPGNYKGFANADVEYHPYREDEDEPGADAYLRELFVDFNFGKAVYFRAGKQVLKWGRCYLWNPTDVINIEKNSFVEEVGSREGTYGLKMSIPFGTAVNIYGFADMYKAEEAEDTGGALKLEFLIENTEMAFSGWGKKGYHPVAGYDFSTKIFGWDLVGEASASYGSNTEKIKVVSGIPFDKLETSKEDSKWITKAALSIGREFDGRDIPDRYSLRFEFFYNGDGYSENILDDTTVYAFDEPVTIEDPDGNETELSVGTKAMYLAGSGLYEPNYLSRYYAAIFTSVNKFLISEMTLNLNAIGNMTDSSFIVSAGLAYQNINDFKAGLTVNAYLGKENREYTIAGNAASVMLTAGILF